MSIDFASMKKEHKQALALVGMWVIGGVAALWFFVLAPFFADRGKSAGELDELQAQIVKAQVAMEGESKVRTEFRTALADYEQATGRYICPSDDPLTWVTEQVYGCARDVGVGVQSIASAGVALPAWDKLTKAERVYKPYTVRITTECSYAQLVAFLAALEKSNPYLTVTGIIITAQDQTQLKHVVNLMVEWPMWGRQPKLQSATAAQMAAGKI